MIYLVDPKEANGPSMDCKSFCGIKPLYGVPPCYSYYY